MLAPSLSSLQDMLNTCEEYAASHNLKFSTDPDPVKCKTKLMAFLKKPRELPSLLLCGTLLPWVDKVKHLGNTITNNNDRNQHDAKIKTSRYIDKNNSLMQEFYFAKPETKLEVNKIYNSHFTGSQLWDLGSRQVQKLESTYNRSVKIMLDLPWATHRYFIEPLTGEPHVSRVLIKRYLSFINKVEMSAKYPLRTLLDIARGDVRSITGANLRRIMLLSGRLSVQDLNNVDIPYHEVPADEAWRIGFVKELMDTKCGDLTVPGLLQTELDVIMNYLCTE